MPNVLILGFPKAGPRSPWFLEIERYNPVLPNRRPNRGASRNIAVASATTTTRAKARSRMRVHIFLRHSQTCSENQLSKKSVEEISKFREISAKRLQMLQISEVSNNFSNLEISVSVLPDTENTTSYPPDPIQCYYIA